MFLKLLLALGCLQLIIVIHELGHYWFARMFRMRVAKFSVGFGPKLFGWRRKETTFQLAAVPLGGFVQIVGMSAEDSIDLADRDAYPNKPMWQRFLVVLMGPAMNFVLAALFLTFAFHQGVEQADRTRAVIGEVRPGSAAEEAGLVPGDRIEAVDGVPISSFDALIAAMALAGEVARLDLERHGDRLAIEVRPKREGDRRVLGVTPSVERVRASSVGEAIVMGVLSTAEKTQAIFDAIVGMVRGKSGGGRLVGLPGIMELIVEQLSRGMTALLSLVAVLSINLGLFNLLPLPALDGGRLAFLGIEVIRRRPVDARIEGWVHTVGFVLLFALLIFVSLRDLVR